MSISKETKEKIKENNKKITELLLENENLLRSEGLNVPEENFAFDDENKIKIPRGYIRKKEYLLNKYHLSTIASNWVVRSNIGYALQLSDLHNFLINRFYFWGPVATVMYKSAIVNLIAIFEAMVLECANQICCDPKDCSKNRRCKKSFNQNQRSSSYAAIKRINDLGITSFSSEELSRIKELINLRNRVHIRLVGEKEISDRYFNLKLYNEVIILLQRTSEELYNNATSFYHKCD